MCSLSHTLCINVATQLSRDAGTPNASQTGIISEHILSSSSCGNKLGISPELRMELISSSIDSSTTCVSVNRNATFSVDARFYHEHFNILPEVLQAVAPTDFYR